MPNEIIKYVPLNTEYTFNEEKTVLTKIMQTCRLWRTLKGGASLTVSVEKRQLLKLKCLSGDSLMSQERSCCIVPQEENVSMYFLYQLWCPRSVQANIFHATFYAIWKNRWRNTNATRDNYSSGRGGGPLIAEPFI